MDYEGNIYDSKSFINAVAQIIDNTSRPNLNITFDISELKRLKRFSKETLRYLAFKVDTNKYIFFNELNKFIVMYNKLKLVDNIIRVNVYDNLVTITVKNGFTFYMSLSVGSENYPMHTTELKNFEFDINKKYL